MLRPYQLIKGERYYIAVKCTSIGTELDNGLVLVNLACQNSVAGFDGVPVSHCGEAYYGTFWGFHNNHKPEVGDEFYLEVIYVEPSADFNGKSVSFIEVDNTYFGGCNVYTETLKDYSQIII